MVESTKSSSIADDSMIKYLHSMKDSVFERGGILVKLHISAVAHQPYNENDCFTDDPAGRVYCVPIHDCANLNLSYYKWRSTKECWAKRKEPVDDTFHYRVQETERVANTSTIKFETPITVPYVFGEQKKITFGIYQT